MKNTGTLRLENEEGQCIELHVKKEEGVQRCTILIDGVKYHFERMPKAQMLRNYRIDSDPDYHPDSDSERCCCIIAPFSNG